MRDQSGMGLSEVLISLFLASLIMTTLIQLYLSNKRQYLEAQEILEANFDLQWVGDLLSDSIRRAGFTPCLGIDQLETTDTRNFGKRVASIKIESHPKQWIQINRMSEAFSEITHFQSPTQIIVPSSTLFKEQHPLLIADCEHAEIHQILSVDKLANGYLITLTQPLMYSYAATSYVGEWLEEKWFIKANASGNKTMHYKLFQTEELTSLIHSFEIKNERVHEKQLVHIVLGLDKDKTHQLIVAVRGS